MTYQRNPGANCEPPCRTRRRSRADQLDKFHLPHSDKAVLQVEIVASSSAVVCRPIRRARDHRTRIAVVVPAGTLRKVLDDACFDLIVTVSETVDLALDEIRDEAPPINRSAINSY
jgi:hypothetical protein